MVRGKPKEFHGGAIVSGGLNDGHWVELHGRHK